MKRFISLNILFVILFGSGIGQSLFHEDFQKAVLDRYSTGSLDTVSWTLYTDGNKPVGNPDMTYFDQAWNILRDAEGSMQAVSLSFFESSATADRWMITPPIDLASAQTPMLTFRAKALDAQNRDGFEIKLSEGGKEKNDFSVSLQTVRQARTSWTSYTIDLSEYKGKTVRIAFIQNSKDKYLIGMDDIRVYDKTANTAAITGISAPATLIMKNAEEAIAVRAALHNTGSAAITSYTLCYALDNGETVRTDAENTDINPDQESTIRIDLPISAPGNHSLAVWVENINGTEACTDRTSVEFYSVSYASLPRKNFFLEMFSSGTCSSCAPWNAVMHHFFIEEKANVPDNSGNFSVAKYQVEIPVPGDPCVTDETLGRAAYYAVNSAPNFFVNGRTYPLADTGTVLQAFRDSIAKFRTETVATGLQARLEREGNTFKVHAEVTSYLPDPNSYNLIVCLIEDSIHHQASLHNGEKDFYHVVRKMLPGVSGVEIVPGGIGSVIEKDFEYTFDLTEPKIFSSVENMSAVIFLQNKKNNRILQARFLEAGYTVSNATRNPTVEKRLHVYPNPVTENLYLNFESVRAGKGNLKLIDMQGKTVRETNLSLQTGRNGHSLDIRNLPAGIYFLRMHSEEGIFVQKIIKR